MLGFGYREPVTSEMNGQTGYAVRPAIQVGLKIVPGERSEYL